MLLLFFLFPVIILFSKCFSHHCANPGNGKIVASIQIPPYLAKIDIRVISDKCVNVNLLSFTASKTYSGMEIYCFRLLESSTIISNSLNSHCIRFTHNFTISGIFSCPTHQNIHTFLGIFSFMPFESLFLYSFII